MSIAEARQLDQAVPLCVALTWASFNMYLTNPDDDETEALANELVEHAGKYAVESYHGFGLAMQALCRARRGEAEAAAATLYSGLEKLSAARYGVFNWILQAELARCMAAAGRPRQALDVFEAAKINLDERQWYAPELLRIRGELALGNNEGLAVFCIGKTTVAVTAGHAALADFPDAVVFVDIAPLRDKEQIIRAIASAIGLDPQFADPEDALFKFLRVRKALIVLDSCEHLAEKTAEIADRMCQHAPDVRLLATSREALRTAGECVFCLRPLDCPPEQARLTAAEALSYPAARLFVERAGARGNNFSLSDDEAPVVAEICRKLDGIALAIELAAGRAAIFGVRDTLTRLDSRLDLLKFGRRTANPRHQTLRATLDWSYDYLSEVERITLRRVAIFVGHFTLEAALAVVMEEGILQADVTDAIGHLVDKSLIGVGIESRGTFYRLLDTTRAYALEKLAISGEHDAMASRHANS
jgi:predicted ATPase